MKNIYYDPITFEWLPNLEDYTIEQYDFPHSWLVTKRGEDHSNLVDLEDYGGLGSCTCTDFNMRKNPENLQQVPGTRDRFHKMPKGKHGSCKHIRLVRFITKNYIKTTTTISTK